MKKYILFLLNFFTGILGLQAQEEVQGLKTVETSNSLLWRISGKGLKSPSYVFGTIHAICPEDFFFTPSMEAAFTSCRKLVMEMDISQSELSNPPEELLRLPEGHHLSEYFRLPQDYELFSSRLKDRTGLDIETFAHYKPFVLLMAISMKGFSCDHIISYEVDLMEKSRIHQMTLQGLETTHAQLALFENLSREDIVSMLTMAVSDEPGGMNMEQALMAHYKEQNLPELYNLIMSSPEFKGHEKAFLYDRNEAWMRQLPALMNNQPCFIAVGAGHLYGDKGLLNLMRLGGYTVEAIH